MHLFSVLFRIFADKFASCLPGQVKHLLGDEDVCGADGSHEESWNQHDPVVPLLAHQIDGNGPEREHGEERL